jgi:uncharacterized Ntn-hydrolase superfamily protein
MATPTVWPLVCKRHRSCRRPWAFALLTFCVVVLLSVLAQAAPPTIATFSIVGYDPETGDLGVAVQSKFFAVGSVVPWAQSGVGAIATQARGNTSFGPKGLSLLERGLPVEDVLKALLADDPGREERQVGIVDARGKAVSYTGAKCMAWAGGVSGDGFAAQGNILVGEETVAAMARAFEETDGILGERLMRAIEAGQAAGGDSRGMQSAAMLIVRKDGGYGGFNDRYCDLRVDDAANPIAELRRLFDMWKTWALIDEGYRLCDAGAFDKAIAVGLEGVALHPDSGEPYYHLACYYSRAGRPEDALRELARAVGLDGTLRARAKADPDFKPMAEAPAFLSLVSE